ncbi:MAG: hypothetical protein HY289_11085, partial [Planctomycetes bacterium]|nr:hypothetical protein [Planctomycetota bacterium]
MKPRWLCSLWVVLLSSAAAFAQDAKNPLRFVPGQAELIVKVDRPRELLKAIETNELFLEARKLAGVREYYDSTNFQQVYQLIAYFEKQLGQDRDEIIAELTAGGIVIGAKVTPPQGAVLVIQSHDEKKLRRFLDVAFDVLTKELERQESKDRVVRSKYMGHDIGQIGGKLSFAIADGALIVASDEKALKLALDSQGKKSVLHAPAFMEAHNKAPAKVMAWTWLDLAAIRKNNPDFNNGLDAASKDPFQMLLFGGFADLLRRSPSVTAALTPDGKKGYRVSIGMPVGREGMSPIKH